MTSLLPSQDLAFLLLHTLVLIKNSMKMWCGTGPLAVVAALFWIQCVLPEVDARKERKRPKEAAPQHTETYNTTLSNSEEVDGSIKVVSQASHTFMNFT